MKRLPGLILVLSLVSASSGVAQEVNPGKAEVIDLGKGVKLEMVFIPAGTFTMGTSKKEEDRSSDETQHRVTLTKPFYLGKYEVTQDQWEVIMGNNPSETKGPKLPVTNVSLKDCQDFIKKLNDKTKGGFRLPTEAEWEYACRAGTTTAYSFGDKITPKDANYGDGVTTGIKPVGSYKANAFGLYDMHGNVWEWCNDWYGPFKDSAVTDPKGPAEGSRRVLRGGSFYYVATSTRSSNRKLYYYSHTFRYSSGGFRLAKTI